MQFVLKTAICHKYVCYGVELSQFVLHSKATSQSSKDISLMRNGLEMKTKVIRIISVVVVSDFAVAGLGRSIDKQPSRNLRWRPLTVKTEKEASIGCNLRRF